MRKRELWVDIAKGIGIIFVVLGHSFGSPEKTYSYIYWFHMPLFFILSGYFFKEIQNEKQLKSFIYKRTLQLLIPYVSFAFIITFIRYIFELYHGNYQLIWYVKDMAHVVIAGRFISGYYGVFWFITCLYITQILFGLILLKIRSKTMQIISILVCYILAHIESQYGNFRYIIIPFGADASLIAIVYIAFGYYGKTILQKTRPIITISSLLFILLLIILNRMETIRYTFNMKPLQYTNVILDLLVPIAMTILLCELSKFISLNKHLGGLFSSIGVTSLIIMYLHKPVTYILQNIIQDNDLFFVLIGVTIPFVLSKFIIEKNAVLQALFLGKFKTNNKSIN